MLMINIINDFSIFKLNFEMYHSFKFEIPYIQGENKYIHQGASTQSKLILQVEELRVIYSTRPINPSNSFFTRDTPCIVKVQNSPYQKLQRQRLSN
jgi:hypothetical protein